MRHALSALRPAVLGFAILVVTALGLAVAGPGASRAQEPGRAAEQREQKLAFLFQALKTAHDEASARLVASQIWALWYQSGDDDVDLMMRQARQAMSSGELGAAISRVSEVLKLRPKYAEAWNLRATILFYQGRDAESVADIERTLSLEPRHFGALSGMVMINMRARNWDGALKALEAGLKIHPYLQERALKPRLEEMSRGKAL